jgi:autotransporter-associated beta strand protein
LEIGGAGVLGGGTYAANIVNNSIFIYNSTATQTLSGVISGTGNLIVTNTGNLILTGVNTYNGAMTVKGGTLTGVTGCSCSNSSVTVTNSPGLTSTIGVLITNNTQQWTCKSLTFKTNGVGSQLRFRYTVSPSTNIAPLNITSNLAFAGKPEIVMDPANLTPGTYPLLVVGGVIPPEVPSLSSDGLKELGYQGGLEWSGNTLLFRLSTFGTVISIR